MQRVAIRRLCKALGSLSAVGLAALIGFLSGCERSSGIEKARGVVLNEVCATQTVPAPWTDPQGNLRRVPQPWVEIYNPGPVPIGLDGYSLTDNYARPKKFRFPLGLVLDPEKSLIVFLFDSADCFGGCLAECQSRCLDDCDDAFDDCRRACGGLSGQALRDCVARCEAAKADCDAKCLAYGEIECDAVYRDVFFADCKANCEIQGLVAGFRLNRTDETLYLFADDGRRVVAKIDARYQADRMTYGVDPETGLLSIFYFPTPGQPNRLGNFKPHSFVDFPRREPVSDCGRAIRVRFRLERDVEPQRGPLEVFLEYAASKTATCSDLVGALDAPVAPAGIAVGRTPVSPISSKREMAKNRAGASGVPVSIEVELLDYEAFLPPAECGVTAAFRVSARDPEILDTNGIPLEVKSPTQCVLYGEEIPPVLVGEYQPRNTRIAFERFGEFDRLFWSGGEPPAGASGRVVTPDWLEVVNVGEEAVDISLLGLATRADIEAGTFDRWLFGFQGVGRAKANPDDVPRQVLLYPGEIRLVLADNDGGRNRQWYYRSPIDEESRRSPFYSAHFALGANRRPPEDFDEFYLVDSRTRTILDRVVLDFSGNVPPEPPYDILPDRSAGRFEEEGSEPDALRPGTVTECPTPGAPNLRECEVAPSFAEGVIRESASGFGCPGPLEAVALRARVNFDRDTVLASDRRVEVELSVDGAPFAPVDPSAIEVLPSPASAVPAPASSLFEVRAVLPGQKAGTLVVFRFVAQDLRLARAGAPQGAPVVFSEETAPRVSFRYLVGGVPPTDHPRINEVLPGNRSIDLPAFECLPKYRRPHPDFVEIYNPASEPVDLGGYYLADAPNPESPLERARRWRFPDGTIVDPRGYAVVYFAPPPDCLSDDERARYLYCPDMGLRACGETLYLVAPDDPARGANCIVDSVSWNLPPPQPGAQAPCFPVDTTIGYPCQGTEPRCSELSQWSGATPGKSNHGSPLAHDGFHVDALSGELVGTCVKSSGALVQVQAIFFLDSRLVDANLGSLGRGVEKAVAFVDRGAGEEQVSARVAGFTECATPGSERCARPPRGFRNVSVTFQVSPLATLGRFPPVTSYRVSLVDAGGAAAEAGPFTFGTCDGPHPELSINELNRSSVLPGVEREVSWVEIYNRSDSPADLSGMFLSDDPWNPRKAVIPAGTTVPPRAAIVLTTGLGPSSEHPSVDLEWALQPSELGAPQFRSAGRLLLLDRPDRGTSIVDSISYDFGSLLAGVSLGRIPDGSGSLVPLSEPSPGALNAVKVFVRGDADGNGKVNVTDIAVSLRILFAGETKLPECLDALDADDDGSHTATDPIYLGNALFRGGPTIPPPFPDPGLDPTPDEVTECSLGG